MKTRRIAALLTTLAMVLSMMGAPLPAMAAAVADISSESATESAQAEPAASIESTESSMATVTVTPAAVVCEIGATTYPTLYDALVAVQDGETITLLADVTETAHLVMDQGFAFTIEKAGFDLTLTTDLDVGASTDVTIKGAGVTVFEGETYVTNNARLMVNGDLTCYWLDANTQGEIHVTGNLTSTYDDPSDYFSVNITGGTVTIDGSVTTAGAGAFVSRGSDVTVTVGGSVTSAGTALCAEDGGRITVTGDVTSTASDAIYADSGAQVSVTGNVSADGEYSDGIYAAGDGTEVTVTGNVSSAGDNGNGIESEDNAVVTVTGNVTTTGSANYGVYVFSGSQVTVTGAVSADDGMAVSASEAGTVVVVNGDLSTGNSYPCVGAWSGAAVTINGSVAAAGSGDSTFAAVAAYSQGTLVTINGDISSDDRGVYVAGGSGVIVNGTITAPTYIVFGYFDEITPDKAVTAADFVEPTTMTGYKTYTDEISNVWVKNLYSVTVLTDGNGTASASAVSAMAGTTITLTATPNAGYKFAGWEVVSGDVTITGNTFVMPEGDVTVKALFEKIDEPQPPKPPKPPRPKPPVPPKPKPKPPVPPKPLVPPKDTGDHGTLTLPVIMLGYALIALTGFFFVVRNRRIDIDVEAGGSSE